MRKNLHLFTSAACLIFTASAFAQIPQPLSKVCKAVTPPDENAEIIFDIPDGEVSYFSRNSVFFKNDYYEGVSRSTVMGSLVQQVCTEDGTLYFSNPMSDFMLHSYMVGHYDADGSIVIEGPQFIYDEYDDWEEEWVNIYLLPMEMKVDDQGRATYVATDDMKFVLKKTDNGYEAENPEVLLGLATYGELADLDGNPTGEVGYAWLGYGEKQIVLESRPGENGVTPPAEASIEKWAFRDPYENALINVALDGDDLYIQGIDRGVTDAWVKARIAGDKVIIPSGSYLGYNTEIQYFSYIWGSTLEYDAENETLIGTSTDQVVFSYDADKKQLVLQDGYAICSMPENYYVITLYEDVSICRQNRDVNTPPAIPYELDVNPFDDYFGVGIMNFNIPDYDEDGNILDVNRLYYNIYIDDKLFTFTPEDYPAMGLNENMVNVPYLLQDFSSIFIYKNYHTVYFHFELPEDGCGVQSVYINEEGKELRSAVLGKGGNGISLTGNDREVESRVFYNMQGQAVPASYKGVTICRTVYSDGSVRISKTINNKK